MGQNQSARTPREEIKGPPPRPAELPTSRLVSDLGPKSPSYYNPANCVLPSVLTGIKDVQLRPVSQELSQYHPDFKDIFSSPNSNENDQNSENVPSKGDISNGDLPHEEIPNGNFNSTILSSSYPGLQSSVLANGLPSSSARVNGGSVENGILTQSASGKVRGHRRQMSATSSLYIRETIPEDPNEESLEMRGKIDPISMDTSYTSQVSIPVKNSFDLDQSYNMTYAQLAEARRSKTLMDIEKRTGKKLEDLSFDLADNTDEGSFSRNPSVRSIKSAISLDSGMKKKKRAPPPPNHPPPQLPSSTTQKPSAPPPPRPVQPPQRKSHSFEEPPVDYDMDTLDNALVKRSTSLRTPAAPPPPPITKSILKKSGTSGPSTTNNQYPPSAIQTTAQSAPTTPRSTSLYKSPPVLPPSAKANQSNPFLLEIQKKAERISIRRQESEQAEMDKKASNVEDPTNEETSEEVENLNFTDISIAEDEPNLVFRSASLTPRETQDKYSPRPPPLLRQNSVDSGVIESSTTNPETQKPGEGLQRQPSETSTTSGVSSNDSNTVQATRRLSSLLQHDIKIAAQAKATKMVKHTTPVKEKPKDPSQVFREQLQKAAAEREARCKDGKTIDSHLAEQREKEREQEENLVFKSDFVTVKRAEDSKKEFHKSKETEKKDTVNVKEELSEFPRPQFLKKSSTAPSGLAVRNSRQRAPDSDDEDASKNYRDSVYGAEDWVPEDDLSDDNLSDDQTMASPRNGMEGFKTSIIPQKVKDLKAKSKPPKVKEKKYKKNSDSSADERRKFDSIKKFKKSVHKSVRNAFGSISKASGKIMKKQRSEDFEVVQDPPRNWRLTSSHSEPAVNRMMIPDDLGAQEDSSEDEESVLESSVSESHSSHKASESNGRGDDEESEEDEDESKDHDISTMKRAGVAYVNNKGQIVLLPEYDTVNGRDRERFEGSAPKVVPKKKKFAYDATVRRKERELKNEMVSKEIQEKEKQREEEKQKERETELEFRRLRELEARDRLQQLELQAAQMQQQLLQQQQQQMGFLSAPPLPPPTGFQQGYNPAAFEYSNVMNQPNLQHGGIGQHYGSQPTFRGPLFNAGVPGVSYDLNDYMRMMHGFQQNQTNMTSAYGFMLNGSSWPNPVMDVKGFVDYSKMSSNSVPTDDSQRNEVYNTWQGPTKQVVPNPNSESGSAQYMMNGDSPANQQYHSNGASDPSGKGDDSNSDVSVSEGLSPQRASMVAKIHVGDFRPSVTENSVGLFKSSISVPNLSK
ncbi:nucleolar protein dao-5-like [Ostrea edulis]|uniref:nucleolar protein dao-5-like n=1 Tax=Ostrea edulis TaxID=37623 RepID=UPI00209556A7|nr:nucleolar protein dao-5-like [Ostrea edulis]XP_048728357.1 nucleolar protein dao-5-like [Ostrea edulis]XP_048728358.1 nucleolar protein dao-5-like [Ostrea edulis]XP_055997212.1 nucleolar protein dao-5-like [Ostrea edulis]